MRIKRNEKSYSASSPNHAREVEKNQPKADEIHAVLTQSGYYK